MRSSRLSGLRFEPGAASAAISPDSESSRCAGAKYSSPAIAAMHDSVALIAPRPA